MLAEFARGSGDETLAAVHHAGPFRVVHRFSALQGIDGRHVGKDTLGFGAARHDVRDREQSVADGRAHGFAETLEGCLMGRQLKLRHYVCAFAAGWRAWATAVSSPGPGP